MVTLAVSGKRTVDVQRNVGRRAHELVSTDEHMCGTLNYLEENARDFISGSVGALAVPVTYSREMLNSMLHRLLEEQHVAVAVEHLQTLRHRLEAAVC